jgi:hypothetical protein
MAFECIKQDACFERKVVTTGIGRNYRRFVSVLLRKHPFKPPGRHILGNVNLRLQYDAKPG